MIQAVSRKKERQGFEEKSDTSVIAVSAGKYQLLN